MDLSEKEGLSVTPPVKMVCSGSERSRGKKRMSSSVRIFCKVKKKTLRPGIPKFRTVFAGMRDGGAGDPGYLEEGDFPGASERD